MGLWRVYSLAQFYGIFKREGLKYTVTKHISVYITSVAVDIMHMMQSLFFGLANIC